MVELVLFLLTLAVPFLGCAKYKYRTEDMIPLGFFAALVLLYVFALFSALPVGIWATLGLAGLCYAVGLVALVRSYSWKDFAKRFFSPAFWVWLILFAVIWFSARGKFVHFYDEFTHWGDVVKVMCEYDLLATQADARSLFSTYPPGMALLQYFAQKLNKLIYGANVYREDLLYMTAQWFMLSLYLPFVGRISYRRPWQIVFAAGSVFMLPLFAFRSSAYAQIYIDSFLGMLGGFVILYAFVCDKNKKFEVLTLALALVSLVLTKDVGILFAIGGVMVWCANVWLRRGGMRKLNVGERWLMFGIAGGVLIAWISWKVHIALSGAVVTQASFQQQIDFAELLAVARNTSAYPWRRTVLNKYINQFIQPIFYLAPINSMVTHASLLLLAGGGMAWLANIMEKKGMEFGRHFRWTGIAWGSVVIVYIVGMGILYLFKYNYEEAITLSAWNRYMDTLIAYGTFSFAAGCMYAIKEQLISKNAKILVVTLMLVMVPWAGALDALSGSEAEQSQLSQNGWIELADEMKSISEADGLGNEARVYLAYDYDLHSFLSMRYRLRPLQVNDENWELGQYNADAGREEAPLTLQEMQNKLMYEYDYLILCEAGEMFAERYQELFTLPEEILQGGIYRIEKHSGLLQLCN